MSAAQPKPRPDAVPMQDATLGDAPNLSVVDTPPPRDMVRKLDAFLARMDDELGR